MHRMSKKAGFTLIELLVVIAIIGILSTLAIVALGSARQKARDSKRVADINQISKALELYYNENNSYPTLITSGQPLADASTTYLSSVPSSPLPWADGSCANKNYSYGASPNNSNYTINFCTGDAVGNIPAGLHFATSSGMDGDGSLRGWWKLNEDAAATVAVDSSGRGNNGTVVGAPVPQAAANCKVGTCFSFDGANNYIGLGIQKIGNFINGAPAVSFSLWIKYSTIGSSGKYDNVIFVGRQASNNSNVWLNLRGDGANAGKILVGGRSQTGDAFQETTSAAVVSSGSWHHVVGILNYSTGKIDIYVDGALSISTSVSFGSASFVNGATPSIEDSINNMQATAGLRFNGLIDDVRIYTRALSSYEILALYNISS